MYLQKTVSLTDKQVEDRHTGDKQVYTLYLAPRAHWEVLHRWDQSLSDQLTI